uniref:Uncharacterized protein n=1 Tax=Arion vulgaris TaxID=1028688 RepID=A0A0B7ACM2_9EUPU
MCQAFKSSRSLTYGDQDESHEPVKGASDEGQAQTDKSERYQAVQNITKCDAN